MADKKKSKKSDKAETKKSASTKTKRVKQSAAATTKKKSPAKRKGKGEAKKDAKPVIVVTHDQIAQKAYEIWLAKGKPAGQDEQNWLEAKASLEKA